MTRGWVRAGLVALTALAASAYAGELILFEAPAFAGRTFTLRGTAPNFDAITFNDRASSLQVKSGVWEFCTDAYFRGNCRTFGPGDYPDLGNQTQRYSSARELATGSWKRPPPPPPTDGAIVLFDQEGFRGRGFGINVAVPDFDPTGFNDRTRSVIIKRGSWELCTDPDYRGRCRIFARGEYPVLDLGLNDQVSSARPAPFDTRAWPAHDNWYGAGHGTLILFEHDNFEGESRTLEAPAPNLGRVGFGDRLSSLIVRRGTWELCTEGDFQGTCRIFRPGEYRVVGPRFNDRFSSARLIGQ